MKEGAADYLAKPWDDEKLLASVRNLLRLRELQLENARLRSRSQRTWEDLAERYDLCGAVWASERMHAVVTLALQVAGGDVPVLITGPNGAGKEKLAEIVQANSGRQDRPFVRVNAGALPDELLESELFGAEAGAYTGATRRRVGRFEAADGGTLFLDEIGNLSASGRPSSCGSSRAAASSAWGAARPGGWTCASSAPPTPISGERWRPAASAKTSSTV